MLYRSGKILTLTLFHYDLANNQLFNCNFPFSNLFFSQGHAVAGGCVLCLICDYRVMADGARIGLVETQAVSDSLELLRKLLLTYNLEVLVRHAKYKMNVIQAKLKTILFVILGSSTSFLVSAQLLVSRLFQPSS